MIGSLEYIDFVRGEYLADFVKGGGSAVKFAVVESREQANVVRGGLRDAALGEGYALASVDAATVRVHMIDKVFHEVARQIDWDAGAQVFTTRAFRDLGFKIPENPSDLTLERVAS